MGNTSEKNITTHRWFIQKEDEVNSKTFLIPFSLNSMFELQTSLFKTPNATEITITSTNDRVYLNDKKIYINYTQEKEDITYEEIDKCQYQIFRNSRFSCYRTSFFPIQPYEYDYLNNFSLFYYSSLFKEVTLDLSDDMIIKFSSHVTILRNDTINFLKNEFLSHLINNRRLKKDFFNFDKLLYIFKDDFMKNFKLFNYSQIYLKNMTRNNYLQLIPQMLSEEGELFQILSKGDNNVNICMFMLFVIFSMENNSNKEEITYLYSSIPKEEIDTDKIFILGNLISNQGFLSFTKKKRIFEKKNIIQLEIDNPIHKYAFISSHLYDISSQSLFKVEREVLIQPNSLFEVKGIDIDSDDNTLLIKLKMKVNFFADLIPYKLSDEIKDKLGICDNIGDDISITNPKLEINKICSITFSSFSQLRANSFYIGSMKNLFSLDLSNCGLNDNDLIYLTPYITNLTFLKYLNLSQNSLSSVSISFLAQTFNLLKNLEYLNLSQNELGDDGIIELSNELDKLSNLQTLSLFYNKIKYYGLNALGKKLCLLKKLKTLNLSANFVYNEEMDALITSLNSLNSLNCLNLANNQIMTDGLVLLSSKLEKLPHLQHINISENCIKPPGFVAFSENLNKCPKLVSLIFYGNQIGTMGIKSLVSNLDAVPMLRVLNIGFNLITDEEMIILSNGLYKIPNLQILNLRENSIGQKGMRALIYNTPCIPNLTTLDLGWNQIFFEALNGFSEVIRNMTSFSSFNIENNPIRVACLKTFLHELKGIEPSWILVKGEFIKKREKIDYEELIQKYIEKSRCSNAIEIKIMIWSKDVIQRLNNCENLIKLDLSKQKLGLEKMKSLDKCFSNFSKLKMLNLRENELFDEGATELAKHFEELKQIEVLNLRGNKITKEGIKSICDKMNYISGTIRILNLSWNKIGDDGMEILCGSDLSNIESLKLKQNSITIEGLGFLTKIFEKLEKLTYLDLSWNKLGGKGLILLSEQLNQLKTIKSLFIGQNDIKDEAIEIFVNALQNKGTFESISLMNNKITDIGGELLFSYVKTSATIVFFDISLNSLSNDMKEKFKYLSESRKINLDV